LMYWHLGIGLACLLLFKWISVTRRRQLETVALITDSAIPASFWRVFGFLNRAKTSASGFNHDAKPRITFV